MRYKGICVFASMRSGSSFLCEQLHDAISRYHDMRCINLYEYLSPMQVIYQGHRYDIDHRNISLRPCDSGLVQDRLEKLSAMMLGGEFPILKIFPEDYSAAARSGISEALINDPLIYKIFLNRRDVSNQIISYFIAMSTGRWHRYGDDAPIEQVSRKITAGKDDMERIARSIIKHYAWHADNATEKCQSVVWHHLLGKTSYPDLGLHTDDLTYSGMQPNGYNHTVAAKECIDNHDELIEFALRIEMDLRPLCEALQ